MTLRALCPSFQTPLTCVAMHRVIRLLPVLLITSTACAQEPSREVLDAFERFVRPIFATHCISCHGPKKQESGLRFDSRRSVFVKHEFGTLLVKGKPDESRLIEVLQYHEGDVQMPPKGKLPDQSITILRKWIELGAPWPKESEPTKGDSAAWKQHWAFQPIGRPAPPAIDHSWIATDIDRFVLAKLTAANQRPSSRADARTQLRRLYFDLVGLPPTFADVKRFEADSGEKACASIVDELLASKHFGERWARHWMDVARYADTSGYVFREDRRNADAWKYRDWLINAFNDDMSIRDFLIQQIAVDRVLPESAGDKLSATGFLTLGRRFLGNQADIIDDRIDVTTRGMMGFTVTCARCHDHKYDPIPTADYYSLYGVFASTADHERKKTTVRVSDRRKPVEPVIFLRGNRHSRGPKVPRQFLESLDSTRKPFTNGSGRLEFAEAIASDANPLTARVFVNRVWGQVMGRYLVDTPSDFGVRSSPPSHPQLLDHLAGSFIEDGWSLKRLLRRIVLSSAYRQGSDSKHGDAQNTLYARMNRKRLEFEPQRDSLLAVSGSLDRTIGGQSVEITKAPFPNRRTVYAYIDRQNLPGVFRAFDLASPDTHAPRRHQTTVPQQGLFQLNHPFVLERAQALAELTGSSGEPAARVRDLFRRAYSREPTAEEITNSLAFVTADRSDLSQSESGWRYGYGRFDKQKNRVTEFTPYPAFIDRTWRGTGPSLPDPQLGWSLLTAKGGHPGEEGFAAIRRWIAPHDGVVSIRGVLRHSPDKGDGVNGRIVSSRTGLLKEGKAANSSAITVVPRVKVQAGETIDFVCASGETLFHDSFDWRVQLTLSDGTQRQKFDSEKDFSDAGSGGSSLDPWAQLAQVLLMANEFIFVD